MNRGNKMKDNRTLNEVTAEFGIDLNISEKNDNPWSLYDDEPGFEDANKEITIAIEKAKKEIDSFFKPNKDVVLDAVEKAFKKIVNPITKKYGKLGAQDTASEEEMMYVLKNYALKKLKEMK